MNTIFDDKRKLKFAAANNANVYILKFPHLNSSKLFMLYFLLFYLQDMIGSYTFIVFIMCLIPAIILLQKYLPETKQNTFVENAALFLPDSDQPRRMNSSAELAECEEINGAV